MPEAGTVVKTTCPYCGVGCGLLAARVADGTIEIKGDPEHPANFGRICSKGDALAETIDLDGRLLYPQIKGDRAAWNDALALVANKFRDAVAQYGPDSVAFYVSGQILTEDYYVANKLMKGFIGSANIDTNSRLCMASSVAGHRKAFGSDTVPGTYEDLEQANLIVLTGSNLMWCHPVLHQRIAAIKERRPDLRVVLIDPRRTQTAEIADLHLAIRPDSDVALFAGLLHWLDEHQHIDLEWVRAHTNGFDQVIQSSADWNLQNVADLTGVPTEQLTMFYRLWAATEKTVTAYGQGVNQSSSGTDKVSAIINCHLATARIGKPGMGPFSLTGQPNAMGGREVGGLSNMLAAHLDIENAEHRDLVQRFWNSPTMADKAGLKAVDLFRAVGDGRIKALWIMATNPVVSMPEADSVKKAIRDCPFVVVSDVMATTDTVKLADVKLPSLAWGEKNGVVTNSERCVSRQRAFLPAPGEARSDWWQLAQVARRMGFESEFAWTSPAEIFREHAALTAFENNGSRDLDLTACAFIDEKTFAGLKPFQWPQAGQEIKFGTRRYFADGQFFTEDRRARFIPIEPKKDIVDEHLLRLNTGRVRDHWHTMTRTGKSPRLSAHRSEPYCEVHPKDASELHIVEDDLVRLSSEHGDVIVRAKLSDSQQQGSVFVPMHWNDETAANARIDRVIASVVDPHSGQPASKHMPVTLERINMNVHGFAMLRDKPSELNFPYWSIALAKQGWLLEFAESDIRGANELAQSVLHSPSLSCLDETNGIWSFAKFHDDQLLGALYLSTRRVTTSRSWAADQLGRTFSDMSARWRILAGRPESDIPDKGAIVCSCMNVGINEIVAAINKGALTVEAVGQASLAGTNCGSCKAEIREIINASVVADAKLA